MSAFAEVNIEVREGKGGWKGEEVDEIGEGRDANTSEAESWVGGCVVSKGGGDGGERKRRRTSLGHENMRRRRLKTAVARREDGRADE